MKKITKTEFFEKMDWEGDFEGMWSYYGNSIEITDDPDMNAAWSAYCAAIADLSDIYDEWEATREEVDIDETE